MSQFRNSPRSRRPPYVRVAIIAVVLIAALVGLSMVDSSKVPQRVEKAIPDSALAK